MQLYPDEVLAEIIPHPKAEKLRNARGKQYGKLIREVYNDFAWQLEKIVLSQGRVSVHNLAQLAIASNLCLKHTVEFLEWRSVLPSGTYDRLKDRGLKPQEVLNRVKAR